jgi:hypothetical protein
MQNIVDAYVKLGNTKALEDLKAHRQGLVIAVDGRKDFDFHSILEHPSHVKLARRGSRTRPPERP